MAPMNWPFVLGGILLGVVVVLAGVLRLSDAIARGTGLSAWGWLGRVRRAELLEHRRHQGQCPRCGYDLTGNASGVCPECGTRGEGGGEEGTWS
jgi:hypothetical protein